VVTATKVDQTQSAQVGLNVTDVAGNTTSCDPVMVTVTRSTGAPSFTYANVPQAEGTLTIYNGSPGLSGLAISVNGTVFGVNNLKDGEVRTVDISSAMVAGDNNKIVMATAGRPGAAAYILIWGGTP
jgi:hypothetical protein